VPKAAEAVRVLDQAKTAWWGTPSKASVYSIKPNGVVGNTIEGACQKERSFIEIQQCNEEHWRNAYSRHSGR